VDYSARNRRYSNAMLDGLVFGWRTAILSVAAAILLPIACGLWRALANRVAARTLAALLVVLIGVFTPWLIGFAGFYDRWRWLTFAPLSSPLFVPPLLYLYGHALAWGRWPAKAWRYLVPGAVQFAFQALSFLLPWPLKDRWADMATPAANAIFAVALTISFVVHGRAALGLLVRYRAALAAARSDDARFAARWLGRSVVALGVLFPVWAGTLLWDAVAPIGYLGLMGLYAAIAAFALYLGIEGWRHALLPFPTIDALEDAPPAAEAAPRDWRAQGEAWAAAVRAGGWQADPELGLKQLARLLGTNSAYLSRALNEGLGMSFSSFVNGLRCEAVAEALRAGTDRSLLDLAFEAGFASKASFNRAFRQRYGVTPRGYRGDVSSDEFSQA
jgi:AraC-like DNA-binding protein